MSSREEFEKLPEIAERLHTVFYNKDLNQYHAAMISSGLSVKYIQGAWYAFQEQQKSHQQETEHLKTELLAAEAEVARLQSGLDELKKTCIEVLELGVSDEFERGWDRAHHRVLRRIEGIIGTSK